MLSSCHFLILYALSVLNYFVSGKVAHKSCEHPIRSYCKQAKLEDEDLLGLFNEFYMDSNKLRQDQFIMNSIVLHPWRTLTTGLATAHVNHLTGGERVMAFLSARNAWLAPLRNALLVNC